MVVRVLHDQGREPPGWRGEVGRPAPGAQLRREHVQARNRVPHLGGVAISSDRHGFSLTRRTLRNIGQLPYSAANGRDVLTR
jgi:hypothetical protein